MLFSNNAPNQTTKTAKKWLENKSCFWSESRF